MAIFKSREEPVHQPTIDKMQMEFSEDLEAMGSQQKSDIGRIERVELTAEDVSIMHNRLRGLTDNAVGQATMSQN